MGVACIYLPLQLPSKEFRLRDVAGDGWGLQGGRARTMRLLTEAARSAVQPK